MKAIILAAGRGSRMRGLTDERPKCLVELDGRPLLARQVEALKAGGIDEIALVTGYRRNMLKGWADIEFHNPRWAETNMTTSLAEASAWLEAEPCIVSYSDIFYEASAVKSLTDCKADLAICYDPNWLRIWTERFEDPLIDAETFRLGPDNELLEIGNKPKVLAEVEGQYMGLLRFTPAGWAEVNAVRASLSAQSRDRLQLTGALQLVISRGRVPVVAVPYHGIWGEVDSEADLRLYEAMAQS